jgi:hypothetical protein
VEHRDVEVETDGLASYAQASVKSRGTASEQAQQYTCVVLSLQQSLPTFQARITFSSSVHTHISYTVCNHFRVEQQLGVCAASTELEFDRKGPGCNQCARCPRSQQQQTHFKQTFTKKKSSAATAGLSCVVIVVHSSECM